MINEIFSQKYLFSVYIHHWIQSKNFPSSLQNKNIRTSIKPMVHKQLQYKAVNTSDHSHKCSPDQLCFQMPTNDGANLISRRNVSHNTGPTAEQHCL